MLQPMESAKGIWGACLQISCRFLLKQRWVHRTAWYIFRRRCMRHVLHLSSKGALLDSAKYLSVMTTTYWFLRIILGNGLKTSMGSSSRGPVAENRFLCCILELFAQLRAQLRWSGTVLCISFAIWGHYTSRGKVLYMQRFAGLLASRGKDIRIRGSPGIIPERLLVLLHESWQCGLWDTLPRGRSKDLDF